jgi:NAD(P)-dependent dehydrogenase (short-subunit alcohol dehydrogenase family)
MAGGLAGKVALITGAASGIGLATARALAAGGAGRLLLVDRDAASLEAVQIAGAYLVRLGGDVTDEGFWDRSASQLAEVELAVVNAGIATGSPIADLSFAEWRRTLSVNLDGAFLTMRAVLRAMIAGGKGGAVVATASISGIKAEPGTAAYGCSKAGLIQLARVAAKEGAPHRIRVNAIAPGGVETPIWDGMAFFDGMVQQLGSREAAFAEMAKVATPLGRYATPEEIARQIAFLLSDDAAFITGAVLTSDGGYSL